MQDAIHDGQDQDSKSRGSCALQSFGQALPVQREGSSGRSARLLQASSAQHRQQRSPRREACAAQPEFMHAQTTWNAQREEARRLKAPLEHGAGQEQARLRQLLRLLFRTCLKAASAKQGAADA